MGPNFFRLGRQTLVSALFRTPRDLLRGRSVTNAGGLLVHVDDKFHANFLVWRWGRRRDAEEMCPASMSLHATVRNVRRDFSSEIGSSGRIRTYNPPVNSVTQVFGLAGSLCR